MPAAKIVKAPRVWAIPGDDARGYAPPDVPLAIEPLPIEALLARSAVSKFRTEWQPLGKTAYINTDASYRDGVAGVAYDSGALGRRVELVECVDLLAGEYLALLMAMGDAELCLDAPVVFRVDSEAVANLRVGRTREVIEPRDRIGVLLADHPTWTLQQISRYRNKLADELARRPFLPIERSEWDTRETPVAREAMA
jgi:hypothetical protein